MLFTRLCWDDDPATPPAASADEDIGTGALTLFSWWEIFWEGAGPFDVGGGGGMKNDPIGA